MRNSRETLPFGFFEGVLLLLLSSVSLFLLTTEFYIFAFVPVILILAFLFLLRSPHAGYYVIVFLIPFAAYRGLAGDSKLFNISWILGFFLLGFLLYRFVIARDSVGKINSNLWPFIAIYFVISLISALMSPYPQTAFANIGLALAGYVFIVLGIFFISSREVYAKTFPAILMTSITINSFLGIAGTIFGIDMFAVKHETFIRSMGAAVDPNNFSLMAIFSLPFIAHYLFTCRERNKRILLILMLLINLLGIVLTYSRGGALILIIIFPVLIAVHLFSLKPKLFGFVLSLIGFIAVIIISLIPEAYWERQKSVFAEKKDFSISRRLSYLHVGLDVFKDNPVFGSGPGTFRDIFSETKYAEFFYREGFTKRRFAHNTYIEIIVGTGTAGMIFFIVLLWRAVRNFRTAMRNFYERGDIWESHLTRAYLLSFTSLLIYLAIFSDMYHKYFLL
ncbi:MAG: O-antigen ligase family protein, partial [Nitrospirae bacterium]|nr:O-antigen ligase family protein [Nitrospirota bacterium]